MKKETPFQIVRKLQDRLERKTEVKFGVWVKYCGHEAVFVADVYWIAGAVTVRANGPIEQALMREPAEVKRAQFWMRDFPDGGFWHPKIGVFVVPEAQFIKKKRQEH